MDSHYSVDMVNDIGGTGCHSIQKFGCASLGTTFSPIAAGETYPTPQPAAATTLRIKAGGNAADDVAGSGAREIIITGLDETGSEVSEALDTAGASASANTETTFIRVFRVKVSKSGTYATITQPSSVGDIVIENSAGTEDWTTLRSADYARSQSQIGCYVVPKGHKAYVFNVFMHVDNTKKVDLLFMERGAILDTAPPYEAMRTIFEKVGVAGEFSHEGRLPYGPFNEFTDLIFLAKAQTGSADVTIDFEIMLTDQTITGGKV